MFYGPSSKGIELATTGAGRCAYLVYGNHYELLAIAPSPDRAHRIGSDYGLPFRVVGPVGVGEFIDWETVGEEAYGVDYGTSGEYINLKDGLPIPERVDPLTKAQARALPSHATSYVAHREEV